MMNRPFKYKAVFFDFDGVILESADIKTDAFKVLFKNHPNKLNKILAHHLKYTGISRYKKFVYIYKNILRLPLSEKLKNNLGRHFEQIVFRKVITCRPVPGLKPLLQYLQGKAKLFIISGTPQVELRKIVSLRHLKGFFKGTFGSPRTKPEISLNILKKLAMKPQDVLFVGDAKSDWAAARTVGTDFIGRVPKGRKSPFPRGTKKVVDLRSLKKFLQK